MQPWDVVVLGAGAAGLQCAIEAGRRGRRVLLLDHADRAGKKILISGGGRCNFTNLHCTPENFLSENPHFARSALAGYTPADFIAMVEQHRIPFHEKTLGQLFCDRTSRDIVVMLERECASANVVIQLETSIQSIAAQGPNSFTVETSAGTIQAESVVVATGGLSIPKMGATGFGYEVARQFGLRIVEPRPGLVPFTFSAEDRDAWCELAGVSAEVLATLADAKPRKRATSFRENLLITHRGLSGPAILQISSFWAAGDTLVLDLAPDQQVFASLLDPHSPRDLNAAFSALKTVLTTRLAHHWLTLQSSVNPHINPHARSLNNAAIAEFERQLHAWRLAPAGTEGFAKAEVTAGGVDTSELDSKTMQCRKVPGLYFIGEVVDVTGWLGGFNFQWAWASGFSAGQSA
jgi:predicted Rossmann fold flavoprotein